MSASERELPSITALQSSPEQTILPVVCLSRVSQTGPEIRCRHNFVCVVQVDDRCTRNHGWGHVADNRSIKIFLTIQQ